MIQYIPLIVIAVFILFVIAGMIWGIIRGLKKQSFRLGWVVCIALILFFVTPFITKALLNMNLSFLNLQISNIKLVTLTQFIQDYICSMTEYGTIIADNPQFLQSALVIVSLAINSIIYVLMFWLSKIILWPIWAILSAVLIKKKNAKGEKKPRHRVWGMVVGAFAGIIIGATTLMPVMGISRLVLDLENESKNVANQNSRQVQTDEGLISSIGGKQIIDILNVYDKSFASGFFKYSGIEFFNNAMFSGLSTTTINDEKIVLKSELSYALKTFDSVNDLRGLQFNNFTDESVEQILETLERLNNNVFGMKTLIVLGNDILPYIINEMITNPQFVIQIPSMGNVIVDDLIKDCLNEVKTIKTQELKGEISSLLNIANLLNNKKVLVPLLNKQPNTIKTVCELLDSSTINNVTNEIFKMKTLGNSFPLVINAGVSYLASYLNIDNFELDKTTPTVEDVKILFNTVLNVGLEVYNSLDFNSKFYVTKQTLPLTGQILDVIKSYKGISENNYNLLINGAELKIQDMLNNALANLDAKFNEVKTILLQAIQDLSEVTNFQNELTTISNVYDDLIFILTEDFSNFGQVGKVIDGLNVTQLFGKHINPLMVSVLDIAKTMLPAEFEEMNNVIEVTKTKINTVSNWERELVNFNKLFNTFESMKQESDLQNVLFANDNTLLLDLGEGLNDLNNSKLLGTQIKDIVNVIINYVEKQTTTNQLINQAFTQVKQNIKLANDIDWKIEFGVIKDFVSYVKDYTEPDSTITIEQLGAKLDSLVSLNSILINRNVINEVLKSAIDELSKNINDNDVKSIIVNLKTAITKNPNISYKQELSALQTLFDKISEITGTGFDYNNFDYVGFGGVLESFKPTGTQPSVLISSVSNDIVKFALGKVKVQITDNDIVKIVDKMIANVDGIESYTNEFTHLKNFVGQITNITEANIDSFNFENFGKTLDGFETSILIKNVRSDIISLILGKLNFTTNSASEFVNAMADIKNNINNIAVKIDNGTMDNNYKYVNMFTELSKLQQMLTNVGIDNNLSMTTYENVILNCGTKLTELDSLEIVPRSASSKLHNYVLNNIKKNLTGLSLVSTDSINNLIETKINDNTTNPDATNFETDYADIISEIKNSIPSKSDIPETII